MPGKTATLPDVDKTLKNARVELKTSPDAKNKLREAAQAVGVDLSAFILSAAMERAESVLDNQRRRDLHSFPTRRSSDLSSLNLLNRRSPSRR